MPVPFFAIFFPSLPSLTSVQKSSLPFCRNSTTATFGVKVRATSTIPRVSYGFRSQFPFFHRKKVHLSSREFTRLRSSSPFSFSCFRTFVFGFHLHFPNREITKRITKERKFENTKKCSLLCESLPNPHRLSAARIRQTTNCHGSARTD